MVFGLGIVFFILGSGLVALCLTAIPGPQGADRQSHASQSHGHGAH